MSGVQGSPFYREEDDLLLGREIWPMTCRCLQTGKGRGKGRVGAIQDGVRNMYVCSDCRKPSIHHEQYVRVCFGCGDRFVIWQYNRETNHEEVCEDCGGENVAPPNKVTPDPVEAMRKKLHKELA